MFLRGILAPGYVDETPRFSCKHFFLYRHAKVFTIKQNRVKQVQEKTYVIEAVRAIPLIVSET